MLQADVQFRVQDCVIAVGQFGVEGIISDADVFSVVKLDVRIPQKLLCNL